MYPLPYQIISVTISGGLDSGVTTEPSRRFLVHVHY